ncbi:MAG: hypothetical protein IPK97_02185 [Ahniella sp.]|nr:hypothetical protein [Ahniella sp.]
MKITFGTLIGAVALLTSGSALADTIGSYGTVAQVTVNGTSSTEYTMARGRLVIDEGQEFYRHYQWGGTACNGKNMSADDIANLLLALKERRSMTVTPAWIAGAGDTRCLVSYRITAIEVVQ